MARQQTPSSTREVGLNLSRFTFKTPTTILTENISTLTGQQSSSSPRAVGMDLTRFAFNNTSPRLHYSKENMQNNTTWDQEAFEEDQEVLDLRI